MVDGSTAKQLQWNREGVAATKLALKCVFINDHIFNIILDGMKK